MNYPISEKDLIRAARRVREVMLESLPSKEEFHHDFSLEFEAKMEKVRRKRQRTQMVRRFTHRAAAFFLAILIGFGSWMAVDAEARTAVIKWVREVYESSILYRFFGDDAEGNPADYVPTWLPSGYKETDVINDISGIYRFYTKDEQVLVFSCVKMTDGTQSEMMSSDYEEESVFINGTNGTLYLAEKSTDTNDIVWTYGDLFFRISAFEDKSELVEIAESVVALPKD